MYNVDENWTKLPETDVDLAIDRISKGLLSRLAADAMALCWLSGDVPLGSEGITQHLQQYIQPHDDKISLKKP